MNFNYCPNCGKQEITTENGHRHFCNACGYEFFFNTAIGVAAIIVCDGEVLFNVRAKAPKLGKLDLPGGFVDHDEAMETALTRELKEELGLDLSDWRYYASGYNTYHYNGVDYKVCDGIFITELASKPKLTLQESEVSDTKWIKFDDIPLDDLAFIPHKNALERLLAE